MNKKPLGGSSFECDIRRQQAKGGGPIKHQLISYQVVILHPSMCCPELIHPDNIGKPLRLIVATDNQFYQDYMTSPVDAQADKSGWPFRPGISRTIARFIKIQQWLPNNATKKKALPVADTLVSDLVPTAFTSNIESLRNVACTYLGGLDRPLQRTSGSGCDNPQLFALLHESARTFYRQKGLQHVFEIQLHGVKLDPASLYEISWVICDYKLNGDNPFLEWQDAWTLGKLASDQRINKDLASQAFDVSKPLTFDIDPTIPIQNHHFFWVGPTGKDNLDIGHLTDVHVSSRHFVFKKSKAQVIPTKSKEIGSMTHASFDALKDLMDQFGNTVDVLIFTGDLIDYGRNYNPKAYNGTKSSDIWTEMNLDLMNKPIEKSVQADFNFDDDDDEDDVDSADNYEPDNQKYPRSIDNVTIYSLFHYFYRKYNKPILLVSGNHEAYSLPYGISPRVPTSRAIKRNLPGSRKTEKELIKATSDDAKNDKDKLGAGKNPFEKVTRANAGIPADHNLTISEATLMYGPDFARVAALGSSASSGEKNFRPENLDWFFIVFTPMSDFILQYKQQLFLGLAWGEDEKFFSLTKGAFLPMATESLDRQQQRLIDQALAMNATCPVLLTHFTLINYDTDQPITAQGEIRYGLNISNTTLNKFNYGTFKQNHNRLFEPLVASKFRYTLAGHSHRSGLYHIESNTLQHSGRGGMVHTRVLSVRGQSTPVDICPRRFNTSQLNGHARILVSACGGPIAVQNHQNELANCGLDYPSGSVIRFSGNTESAIEVVVPRKTVTTAQPRLAVALDFADTVGKENDPFNQGVFESITADSLASPFTARVNPRLKLPARAKWIAGATLYLFNGTNPTLIPITVTRADQDTFSFSSDKLSLLGDILNYPEKYTVFIEIKLDSSIHIPLFAHYDITTPWTFRLELTQPRDEAYQAAMMVNYSLSGATLILPSAFNQIPAYGLQRHGKWGEIPEHRWYSKYFKAEYDYPWKGSQKSDEDAKLNS